MILLPYTTTLIVKYILLHFELHKNQIYIKPNNINDSLNKETHIQSKYLCYNFHKKIRKTIYLH